MRLGAVGGSPQAAKRALDLNYLIPIDPYNEVFYGATRRQT